MTFSPGWCYQPRLKGPGIYISNGSCSVHLLLFDLHIDHRRRRRHLRSRLCRPALPDRRARLCRAAVVVYPRPAAPSARPRHPVSAAAPEPTLRRRPLPAQPRRRAPPDRANPPASISPSPPYVVLARGAQLGPMAGQHALPGPPSAPASLLASCSRPYFFRKFLVFLDCF